MKRTTLAAALAVFMAGASGASATLVKVTLTGNTERVNDFANVFGLGAETVGNTANITDQPFVETFYVDTAGGNAADTPTFLSYSPFFPGGPPYAVGASVTINGHTFSTVGSDGSYITTQGDYYGGSSDAAPNRDENNISFDIHAYDSTAVLPATVTQPISLNIGTPNYEVIDSFGDASSGGEFFDAAGELYATSLTVSPVSAAPEPAAWALMMIGAATLGVALREGRRRRAGLAI